MTAAGPSLPLVLMLAFAGAAIAAVRLGRLVRMDIAIEPFTAMVHKLVLAANIDRAIKLCAVVPNSVAARGCHAMLEDARDGKLSHDTIGATWMAAVLRLRPQLRRMRPMVPVAGGLAAPLLAVGLLGGEATPINWLVPLGVAGLLVAGDLKARQMEERTLDAWEALLDRLAPGVRAQAVAAYEAGK